MDQKRFLIVGSNGQLGRALRVTYPKANAVDINTLDITSRESLDAYDWSNIDVILNAAAYTNVDGAETTEGRIAAWQANAVAAAHLAMIASRHNITIVHISTDYVFDGTSETIAETQPFSPLGMYGASKAAGDIAIGTAHKHYIIRTSWVVGDGKNFVRTMLELGKKGVNPTVVSDQIGRPTFTSELVRAIDHLLTSGSAYGTYNVSNAGEPVSWAALTREIFTIAGIKSSVTEITTKLYFTEKPAAAKRPLKSVFDMTKLLSTGFVSTNWKEALKAYVLKEAQ